MQLLLDFPNVIGQNGTNYDSELSHFSGIVAMKIMYPRCYRCFFCNGSVVVFSSVATVSGTFVT